MPQFQLNVGDHASLELDFGPIPAEALWQFRWARTQALWIAANKPGANPAFMAMPNGRPLTGVNPLRPEATGLLEDPSIWVNYFVSSVNFGFTPGSDNDIGVSNMAVAIGQWTVLATIIHELGHINGCPGFSADQTAEQALVPCGLGYLAELLTGVDDPNTPFNPNIQG